MTRTMQWTLTAGLVAMLATIHTTALARGPSYELWVVDQANVANGGDALHVYTPGSWREPRELIYLGERAVGVGDGPGVRPHVLAFNSSQSHALLANVASGHVYVLRAADRTVVASIDVGEQAHGAVASPDDRWILVANQNGKRLARIRADFAAERFAYEPEADLDLRALEDDAHPDNAPICPVMYVGMAGKAYVMVRGGGLYVVDTLATPMAVTRAYSKDQIGPSGCGGLIGEDGRVYVNSGSATSGSLYALDPASDDLVASLTTAHTGTDAHGMVLVGGRYLWIANRGDGDNVVVVDTRTFEIVGTIPDVGAAPDLMELSPGGAGVERTTRLVFYGDNNNWFAAFAYWIARMYGHPSIALMNGGRKKWELEGRPLTTNPPRITPTVYEANDLDLRHRAFLRDVSQYVETPDGRGLVDLRSPAEYNGEIIAPPGLPETAQRCGHVPGAANIPWIQTANEDGTFKRADELRALYAAKGIVPDKEVITYCRIGERSSHTWFVLTELLGFPRVRNYDGSWTEYGSVIGVPIANPTAGR